MKISTPYKKVTQDWLKKLDWYIIRKFLGTFFYAIIILAVISCVIDYSEKVDDFVKRKAPFWAIMNYYKDFVPHITALLFPLFIFIATIFFTSRLAYRSEVIAILSSGVSFQRFLRPYLIGGGFLCILSLIANHWIIPNANKERIAFEDKYTHDPNTQADYNAHIGLTKNLYVYIQNYNFQSNTGQRFTAEKVEDTHLVDKLMAESINYDTVKKLWHLHNVLIRHNDSLSEKLTHADTMTMNYAFTPQDLSTSDAIKEALTTPELIRYTAKETLRGRDNLNFYYVEKDRRTAQPFAAFILTIIGVCIASKRIRGGSGFHLAIGIVISVVYIMLLQFSTTFSTKADLNPLLSVWIPNVLFAIVAYYLVRKQIK